MDLGSYGVDFVRKGDTYLMPLQTLTDILGKDCNYFMIYTGKKLFTANTSNAFMDPMGNVTDYGKLYYKSAGMEMLSKEYAEYNYNELCFALDHFYGLKEIQHISSFRELFHNMALDNLMLSGDPLLIDAAIYILMTKYIDDGHSTYQSPGFGTGADFKTDLMKELGISYQTQGLVSILLQLRESRAKFYPEGVPGYEEIGDTAFITFDTFVLSKLNYYDEASTNDPSDTFTLMSYSVQQILRKNSPIKNVVLDLSCNTGGMTDTAIYTIAALLGKASISIEDSLTGALVTSEYIADTNLDHKFSKNDYLSGKGLNLYCLESGVSFSCGNLVPNVLKASSEVTLLGRTSGGGSCTVGYMCSANGSMFNISSTQRLSFMKNCAFYDIDRGVDPDFTITKWDNFYDRKKLVEYIDSLL